ELVLLRPRRLDGVYTSCADPQNTFNEGVWPTGTNLNTLTSVNLYELVPVDSYDFNGLAQGLDSSSDYEEWSYIRQKGNWNSLDPANVFKTTYPGRYVVPANQRQSITIVDE